MLHNSLDSRAEPQLIVKRKAGRIRVRQIDSSSCGLAPCLSAGHPRRDVLRAKNWAGEVFQSRCGVRDSWAAHACDAIAGVSDLIDVR